MWNGANRTRRSRRLRRREVSARLPSDSGSETFSGADADLQWAIAVAAFAEILKQSPYAEPASLDAITGIVNAQATRDLDRGELSDLFRRAIARLR